jgi:hypothetical protein
MNHLNSFFIAYLDIETSINYGDATLSPRTLVLSKNRKHNDDRSQQNSKNGNADWNSV